MDDLYSDEMARFQDMDTSALRTSYIDVALGQRSSDEYLKAAGVTLKKEDADRVLKLVEAQYYRQVMYASCVFFFPDLDSLSTLYGIANAARAIALVKSATNIDLSSQFRRDLSIATGHSARTGQPVTGASLFDEVYQLSD
jgi:hypothetical protein